jgi:hypothetical protein
MMLPVATTALLTAALICQVQEAKANTLTPQEIADGWILLFDGATPFGWKTSGDVQIKDGVMVLQPNEKKTTRADLTTFLGDGDLRLDCLRPKDNGPKESHGYLDLKKTWSSSLCLLMGIGTPCHFKCQPEKS